MASNKVTLRTGFVDNTFVFGDVTVTYEGTEFPSRTKADEALEAAKRSGVQLFEVEPDAAPSATNENKGGNG